MKHVFQNNYGSDLADTVREWLDNHLEAYNSYGQTVIVEIVPPEPPKVAEVSRGIIEQTGGSNGKE